MNDEDRSKKEPADEVVQGRSGAAELEAGKSEREQTQELLRTSFNSSPIGIYVVQHGRFELVNSRYQEFTGYSEGELMGMNSLDLVASEDREMVRKNAIMMLKEERSSPYEFRYVTKAGEQRWVMETVTSIQYQGERATLGNFMDITERRRAEEELRMSEERYRTLVENTNDVIYNLDPEGRVTYISPTIEQVSGYKAEEIIGKPFTRFVHGSDLAGLVASLQRTLAGDLEPYEFRVLDTKYRVHYVRTSSRPVLKDGRLVGLVGIMADITGRRLVEQRLEEYSDDLEKTVEERTRELRETQEKLIRTEKLAAIGEVAGGLGHELRSPLGAIKFSADFLKTKLGDSADEKVMKHLDLLKREVDICDQTISDLLEFSRPGKLNFGEVDISQVVREVIQASALPGNVEVSTGLAESLPPVMADANDVRRALSNLVTNAIQAMPGGGRLSLNIARGDEFVEVRVADTGVGIPPEQLKKVFEPLFTTRVKGIGLGLAIVKAMMERQGGTIEVESQVGVGTTFIVKLPIAGEGAQGHG